MTAGVYLLIRLIKSCKKISSSIVQLLILLTRINYNFLIYNYYNKLCWPLNPKVININPSCLRYN